jgi:hypothetical protein
MKKLVALALILSFGLMTVGCNPPPPKKDAPKNPPVDKKVDNKTPDTKPAPK